MSSITDLFYQRMTKKASGEVMTSTSKKPKKNLRKALDWFNNNTNEDDQFISSERFKNEPVVEWERRLREAELSIKNKNREALYEDQYRSASVEDYESEAEEVNNFVTSQESYESTGREPTEEFVQYAQWSQGDVIYEDVISTSDTKKHKMDDIEVNAREIEHIASQTGMDINEFGSVLGQRRIKGLSSDDWEGAPEE